MGRLGTPGRGGEPQPQIRNEMQDSLWRTLIASAPCAIRVRRPRAVVVLRAHSLIRAADVSGPRPNAAECNWSRPSLRRGWLRPRSFADALRLRRAATSPPASGPRAGPDLWTTHQAAPRCRAHPNIVPG